MSGLEQIRTEVESQGKYQLQESPYLEVGYFGITLKVKNNQTQEIQALEVDLPEDRNRNFDAKVAQKQTELQTDEEIQQLVDQALDIDDQSIEDLLSDLVFDD
eukprot:TRINITY_DN6813_c1_g1_i1.p3 TRINITY_DN6813_c1_g1~~TRINITY_DN6813_c1_g1_i1.p3  ORF type:complete len:103 (-),score=12.13 TRINITY_DN6813_c1_g1_i1:396-704(-)